ncbi:hypothetical protein [Pelagibacterium halotolerans]|uniref:hypothetical protein n=1 Tax=Pelagibacterium halotolerans TaxID=531813 RepID=UPI0005A2432D|nr:hypothetical protein [Pelagibacterium halotolerans]QJR19290.1 hypothetical protein HKM20_13080 [Pelagibacterium halotolerans]SDZ96104.1 hypothetical protein SAMN05428936_101682 [Pelagibacterium halotolerans]
MLFKDLYEEVVGKVDRPPVPFDLLMHLINTRHAGVGEIKVWSIKYPMPNRQAHYKLVGTDRTSAYEEEFDIAEIRYCEELNDHPRERRFALTKELMHVFDTESEKVDTREKFVEFVKEVQNQPLASQRSERFNSELDTRWMAAIILCPKPLRDIYLTSFRSGAIQPYEIAEALRVPEWVIPFVMDDYYDQAFDLMMRKGH